MKKKTTKRFTSSEVRHVAPEKLQQAGGGLSEPGKIEIPNIKITL